jgi:predicted permease
MRFRSSLVTLQIALSAALLVAAALASRSLQRVASIDLGFTPDDVVVAAFDIDLPGYDRPRVDAFFAETLRRARQMPGVEHAALAAVVPMSGRGGRASASVRAESQPAIEVSYNRVSDAYFATIGQRLVRGRDFGASDMSDAAPVAIVNEAMARRLWPGGEAVGRLLRLDDEPGARTVVGVVADAAHTSFAGAVTPLMYLPIGQRRGSTLTLHVRRPGDRGALPGDVARLVREVDEHVAPAQLTTMRMSMAFALFPSQVARGVAASAGIVGVLLASIGLFGLVSYVFERRVREIGIRVALGARPWRLLRDIAGGALAAASIGIGIGLTLAAVLARLAASFLHGVAPFDPIAFGSVCLLLITLTLAATAAAARKRLRVDPIVALRHE